MAGRPVWMPFDKAADTEVGPPEPCEKGGFPDGGTGSVRSVRGFSKVYQNVK